MIKESSFSTVSIVTLCYQKFDYIYETIDSVLKQDYPAIEYIIADDCSDNFPEQEIRSYVEQNKRENLKSFIVIHQSVNKGTVKNYNVALAHSTGKFILGLGADDQFFDETIVSKVVDRFEKSKAEVLVCSRYFINEEGELLCISPTQFEREHIAKMKTHWDQFLAIAVGPFYRFASGSAMYYMASMLKNRGGFDEHYRLWEDGPFIAQYTAQKKIYCAYDIICIKYRIGGISDTSDKPENPVLKQEGIYLRTVECMKYIDNFNWYTQERLRYSRDVSLCRTTIDKILCKIKYLHVWIGNRIYQIRDLIGI